MVLTTRLTAGRAAHGVPHQRRLRGRQRDQPPSTYPDDRRGRHKTALRSGITTTRTYNDAGQP